MQSWPAEIRLLVAVALNAFVFAAAVRFVRRQGIHQPAAVAADAFLAWYLVQYLAVALPGLVGLLSPVSMILTGAALAVLLQFVPAASSESSLQSASDSESDPATTRSRDRRIQLACTAILVGLIAAIIWNQYYSPVMANDALTYHLPAAVQWLQTGRIGIYETWFYNPANTYSPLAGSTFAAWALAPLGNDAMARYVQAPPLLMIFLAGMQIARSLGAGSIVAALVALAASCARPFLSQVILAKDDLFVTAFFATALVALARPRLKDRLGPWRLGVAIGLLVATKYTVLFSLPLLLLAIDAPHRAGWRWRQYAIATGVALLLAGPWYLRNLVLTGNPIFPADVRIGGATSGTTNGATNAAISGTTILPGMMRLLRSDRLSGAANVWRAFTDYEGYYTLIRRPAVIVLALWAASCLVAVLNAKSAHRADLSAQHPAPSTSAIRDPLVRVALIGPILGIMLFVIASPYAEIRFAYPSMLMLILSSAIVLGGSIRRELIAVCIAALMAIAMIVTAFKPGAWRGLIELAVWSVMTAAIVAGLVELFAVARARRSRNLARLAGIGAIVGVLVVAAYAFVNWAKYLIDLRDVHYADFWSDSHAYDATGRAWRFVRMELPAGQKLAYANTYFAYPLQGFDLDRPLVYAPIRRGVRQVADLGHFAEPTTGENVPAQIVPLTYRDADRDAWLANLRANSARFLFVGKDNIAHPGQPFTPPELTWARGDPATFRPLFDNPAASVFEIVWR